MHIYAYAPSRLNSGGPTVTIPKNPSTVTTWPFSSSSVTRGTPLTQGAGSRRKPPRRLRPAGAVNPPGPIPKS